MSMAMVLKIFSDCCICFAILGSGPVQFDVPLLIPALLCGASAGVASFVEEKGWTALRRLCAILPLGCLLLSGSGAQALILAVPAVYTSVVILRNKLELEYYAYRRFFLQSLALVGGAYLAVNIWIFLLQITNDTLPVLDSGTILRYGLVHLLCGIVLQRQLRLGVGSRAEGGRRQMTTLLGVAGAIVFGFVVAEPLLRRSMRVVVEYTVALLFAPVALVIEGILRLLTRLGEDDEISKDYEDFNDYMSTIFGGDQQAGQPVQPEAPESLDLTALWAVLAGIFVLIAVVLLFRSFRKRRADADPGEIVSKVVTAPRKKKPSALSNRGRVRQIYRDFLRAEKHLGMKLNISDTSADILQRIHQDTDRDSAGDLRQVYLSARYDDRQSVSRSQVDQAKRALKGTRTKK